MTAAQPSSAHCADNARRRRRWRRAGDSDNLIGNYAQRSFCGLDRHINRIIGLFASSTPVLLLPVIGSTAGPDQQFVYDAIKSTWSSTQKPVCLLWCQSIVQEKKTTKNKNENGKGRQEKKRNI